MTKKDFSSIMDALITSSNYWEGNYPKSMLQFNFDNTLKSMGELDKDDTYLSYESTEYLNKAAEKKVLKLFKQSKDNTALIYKVLGLVSYKPVGVLEGYPGDDTTDDHLFKNILYTIIPLPMIAKELTNGCILNLKDDEYELFDGSVELFENRVQGHNYDYVGTNFGYGGLRFGHSDVKRESYSYMVQTINGSIDVTNKRMIISGSDINTEADRTKIINMGSLISYSEIGDNSIILNVTGNSVIIKLSSKTELENVILCLNQLQNGMREIDLPDKVSLQYNSLDELYFEYNQSDHFDNLDDFWNWIITLFDNHIELEEGKYTISAMDDSYIVIGKEGSDYFRNMIINDSSKWNEKITLIQKNIVYIKSILNLGFSIIDRNYGETYYKLLDFLEVNGYPMDIRKESDKFDTYKKDKNIISYSNRFSDREAKLSDDTKKFLNKIYILYYKDDDSQKKYYIVNFREQKDFNTLSTDSGTNVETVKNCLFQYLNASTEIINLWNEFEKSNSSLVFLGFPFDDANTEEKVLNNLIEEQGFEGLLNNAVFVLNGDGSLDRSIVEFNQSKGNDVSEEESHNEESDVVDSDTNKFDEIKKYKELLDMKIISEDEFELKKKELLNL